MNYHDFKQQIISTLSDRLGSDVRITVLDILKNNDTHLDGLTILAPGQNLAPTIYLDYYYGQYERGRSFSDITDDILTAYRENPRSTSSKMARIEIPALQISTSMPPNSRTAVSISSRHSSGFVTSTPQ